MDDETPEHGALPEPPAPGLGPTRPRRPALRGAASPQAGALVLAGGVLVVVGVFLPWITASSALTTYSVSGKDASEWGFVLLGVFAVVRGLSMVRPAMFRFRFGTPLIGGVLLAVLLALRWSDLQSTLDLLRSTPGVSASLGIGIWSVMAGIVSILVGGLLALRPRL